MKKLILLAVLLVSLIPSIAQPASRNLAFDYPIISWDASLTFRIHSSQDITIPVTNWAVVADTFWLSNNIVPGHVTLISTNKVSIAASKGFFAVSCSNQVAMVFSTNLTLVAPGQGVGLRVH